MDAPLTRRRLLGLGAAVPALALLERAHPALAAAAVCGPPLVEQTEGHLYPGRTEHIHVKLRPRGGRERTTQLYFPGVTENGQDGIFDPRMVLRRLKRGASGWTATFDFVL